MNADEASTLIDLTSSALDRLRSTEELDYSEGISLFTAKNDLLLSYIHHLVYLHLYKLSSRPLSEAKPVVFETVKSRVALEKIRPLEAKLRYQVEKLLKKAEQAAEGQTDQDIANDPLSFRPNPDALVSSKTRARSESVSGNEDDDNQPGDGIYRPPRLAAVPYTEGPGRGPKKDRQAPTTSALLTELATSLNDKTPYAETTSGLGVTSNASNRKQRKLDEMTAYEEENMTRLSMSKKESKRRRLDEEEVALGGGASYDTESARRRGNRGGFEGEFGELLTHIERGSQKRSGLFGRTGGNEYEALRAMRKSSPPRGTGLDEANTLDKRTSGTFEKALHRVQKNSKQAKQRRKR